MRWDLAEVAKVAKIAHVRGESMAEQVAREFGTNLHNARSVIARARRVDKEVPFQLGRNVPVVDPTGSQRVTEIVLQCGCGWTSDNATAMVWHCRTVHDRRATVEERTPKVSL